MARIPRGSRLSLPPPATGRTSVLDHYFGDITVDRVRWEERNGTGTDSCFGSDIDSLPYTCIVIVYGIQRVKIYEHQGSKKVAYKMAFILSLYAC